MLTDMLFNVGSWTIMNFFSLHGSPVYSYYFEFRTSGMLKDLMGIEHPGNLTLCIINELIK